jgi:hypothetical protein
MYANRWSTFRIDENYCHYEGHRIFGNKQLVILDTLTKQAWDLPLARGSSPLLVKDWLRGIQGRDRPDKLTKWYADHYGQDVGNIGGLGETLESILKKPGQFAPVFDFLGLVGITTDQIIRYTSVWQAAIRIMHHNDLW